MANEINNFELRDTLRAIAATRLAVADLQAELAARRFVLALRANFDPTQPRHPKGSGNVSGRWRDGGPSGAGSGPVRTSSGKSRRLRLPARAGIGHNGGPPLEDPPDLPKHEPSSYRARNNLPKRSAIWLRRAVGRGSNKRLLAFVAALEAVGYLDEFFSPIETYLDEPKSLSELRRDVSRWRRRPGTEVHHIVEKTAAYAEGFSSSMVESPENLVRLPTYRHNEITAWYQSGNEMFGGLSPRQYLRGKSWEERVEVGHHALRKHGALK